MCKVMAAAKSLQERGGFMPSASYMERTIGTSHWYFEQYIPGCKVLTPLGQAWRDIRAPQELLFAANRDHGYPGAYDQWCVAR